MSEYEKAKYFLQFAEASDGYLKELRASPMNSAARSLCPYEPSKDQSLAKRADRILHQHNLSQKKINIVIMNPATEGGMPHTRPGNVICLPDYFPESQLPETLRHEIVHLHQRQYPSYWTQKALEVGWSPLQNEKEIPEVWRSRCRLNPDTFQAPRFWAWGGRYVPLPVFEREDRPQIREVQVRWYDRETGTVQQSPPQSLLHKYPDISTSSMEHPFEFFAYEKNY